MTKFDGTPCAVKASSAGMDLEEQFALMKEFYDKGLFIVRLHTGDPVSYTHLDVYKRQGYIIYHLIRR